MGQIMKTFWNSIKHAIATARAAIGKAVGIATALIFLPGFALAFTPESGWWYNPAESGRGFAIEVQNNTVFMSGFLYEAGGAPLWFVTSASYSQTNNRFEGDMLNLRGGQCLSCTFRPPVLQPSLGRISVSFTSPSTATLVWPGGSVPIVRQIYGVSDGIDRTFGTFAFSTTGNSGRVHFGNWLSFTRTQFDASLGTYAVGSTESGRSAVAAFNADKSLILILVDASSSYWESYVMPTTFFGTREGSALWATYLKTQTAPTPTAYASFHRVFPAAVSTTGASVVNNSAVSGNLGDAKSAHKLAALSETAFDALRKIESQPQSKSSAANVNEETLQMMQLLLVKQKQPRK